MLTLSVKTIPCEKSTVPSAELFCIFNADGSFDPKELTKMFDQLNDNQADFVFATRYEKNCGSEDDTLITLTGNYIFTFLGKIFFNTLNHLLSDLVIYSS